MNVRIALQILLVALVKAVKLLQSRINKGPYKWINRKWINHISSIIILALEFKEFQDFLISITMNSFQHLLKGWLSHSIQIQRAFRVLNNNWIIHSLKIIVIKSKVILIAFLIRIPNIINSLYLTPFYIFLGARWRKKLNCLSN